MQPGPFVDYYETLQISPNADTDTIHRVYRILAQRMHPDNAQTGNTAAFQELVEAYGTLGDPEKRASYDVRHREARRLTWKIFDQSNATQGVEAEKRKRQGILSLLYRKRMLDPEQPTITLREFEDILGVPKEHLEFSLWYLKEAQYIQRTDNGKHAITLRGVELTESFPEARTPLPMLVAARTGSGPSRPTVVVPR